MVRRILGVLSGGFVLVSWFSREIVKAWFFDKVIHMIEPDPKWLDYAVEYGPPLAFAALALWLLWGRPKQIQPAIHTDNRITPIIGRPPKSDPKRPRALSQDQLRQLKDNISEFESLVAEISIFWPEGPPDDPESVDLAMQFKLFFNEHTKVKAQTWPQRPRAGHSGVMVAVRSEVTPCREAIALRDALTKAGIVARYGPMPGWWESDYALFICAP